MKLDPSVGQSSSNVDTPDASVAIQTEVDIGSVLTPVELKSLLMSRMKRTIELGGPDKVPGYQAFLRTKILKDCKHIVDWIQGWHHQL